MLTRGRTLERLDQNNYSNLHCCHVLFLELLTDILYGGPDRSTKGDKFILDLECNSGTASKYIGLTIVS